MRLNVVVPWPSGAWRFTEWSRREPTNTDGKPEGVSLLAQTNQTPYNLRMPESKPLVAVIMGSKSDWETMRHAVEMLDELGVPNEAHVFSAHRTPDATAEFARNAAERGLRVIIAGAGGAAHLAGVMAAHTWLPVLGVPISSALQGLDSLLSTAQMPGGIPVGTLAIGNAGAKNAALLAAAILATSDQAVRQKLEAFRKKQSQAVLSAKLAK
jgi:5-(carboxyamino)imidazole ribonucleotide mutase